MSPNLADALRKSLLVKPVVRSTESAQRLTASLRRLGASDRTVAAAMPTQRRRTV